MKKTEHTPIPSSGLDKNQFANDSRNRKKYPAAASSPRSRKKKRPLFHRIVFAILLLIGCICAFCIGAYAGILANHADRLKELSASVEENMPPTSDPTDAIQDTIPQTTPNVSIPETTVPEDKKPILPQYDALYQQNPDLFGWIRIDNTRIDYPVMHTPEEPEKYLHADFSGSYSYSGLPFLDAACTAESDNLLIYGHNMVDGTMFHALMNYENEDFWTEHPVIAFDSLYETQEYEVMAAFYDRVYYKNEDVFKFYQFLDAEDESDYNNAIAQFKGKALYDTGVNAQYGDQLITLVTCAYHTDNGRFVVVAKKVDP